MLQHQRKHAVSLHRVRNKLLGQECDKMKLSIFDFFGELRTIVKPKGVLLGQTGRKYLQELWF